MNNLKTAVYFFIDIKNSRLIFEQRDDSYQLLINLKEYLNNKFSVQMLTPFSIREGDALIGGMSDFRLIFDLYQACVEYEYSEAYGDFLATSKVDNAKIKFYIGAGIGTITTPSITYLNIEEVNGSAVSNAKEAVEMAKSAAKIKADYHYQIQKFQFYAKGDRSLAFVQILNPLMYLIYEQLISTAKQNELFAYKAMFPKMKNYQLAEKLGYHSGSMDSVTRRKLSSKVSNFLSTTKYDLFKKAQNDLKEYLLSNYYLGG